MTARRPNPNAKGTSGAHHIKEKHTQIPPTRHSSIDPKAIDEPELSSSPKLSIDVRDSRDNIEKEDATYNNDKVDDAHNTTEEGVTVSPMNASGYM